VIAGLEAVGAGHVQENPEEVEELTARLLVEFNDLDGLGFRRLLLFFF
jgi:hypothetical protein